MRNRLSTASVTLVMAASMSACASSPHAAPGTLPAGSAEVTVHDQAVPAALRVTCVPMGSLTKVTIGDTAAGAMALVASGKALTARSVNINALGGFTGSYDEGLQGKADVTITGDTYTIHGVADGFDSDTPSFNVARAFTIKFAC